jgi:NADH-quinone oxidoreductase subunit N
VSFAKFNWIELLPEVILLTTTLVILLTALFLRARAERHLLWVAVAGLVAAGIGDIALWNHPGVAFTGAFVTDHFAVILNAVVLASVLAGIALSPREVDVGSDYLVLMLWAAIGMMVLAGAMNLMVLFLGLEILSLPLYILSAFHRESAVSAEAGMKYLLLGAFSSGIFLYGLALIYGGTGTTDMLRIGTFFLDHFAAVPLLDKVAVGLLLVGLGFKLGVIPFHMWVPDVYEGAPTPVTTFMSVGTKVAAFAALARVLFVALPDTAYEWRLVLWFLSILTMVGGALLLLPQTNMKRLLAYSGIINAGYLLAALSVTSTGSIASGTYFLVAYGVMNLGAFAVVAALSSGQGREEGADLASYRGLFHRRPWLAVAMSLFLLSLASIPPTGGFVGKVYILQAIVGQNGVVLAIAVVFATMVSLYAYLRPIVSMFRPDDSEGPAPAVAAATPGGVQVVLVLSFLGTLALGILPNLIIPFLHGGTNILAGL